MKRFSHVFIIVFISIFIFFIFVCNNSEKKGTKATGSNNDHSDLVSLFKEFREFQKPKITNGVPDYTPAAMAEQRRGLKEFQKRLAAMDISGWPVSQQVDYHIVRAEMNGLDFDHRVRRPWTRDPGFYLISQAGAGPTMYGLSGLRNPRLPLQDDDIAEFKIRLQAVPKVYEQAKGNLTEGAADLAALAIHFNEDESAIYRNLTARLAEHHPDLVSNAERAREAVEDFGKWLEENKSRMTEPAGLGKENLNWWMKNVHLSPYTWDELMVVTQCELERALAFLKLEENKNRKLPQIELVKTEAEHLRRHKEAEQNLRKFVREEEIFTIPEYLGPRRPQPWVNVSNRPFGARSFFEQLRDRDSLPQLCHEFFGHELDGMRLQHDKRPIRGVRRLYAISKIRSEGLAYGLEEILVQAGLIDNRLRAKEINYIAIAFRAVRGIADLKMNNNEVTLKEAIQYCYEKTPYNWLLLDGHEVWYEMETNIRYVGWHGTAFIGGKYQLLKLLADRTSQLGDKFNLCEFMDEFFAAGMIPIALTRWEMTGLDDEIKKLW